MKLFALLLVLVGCGASPEAPRCELGRVQSCPCVGGGQGAQECGAVGVWGVCACGGSDAGADVAVADAPTDRPRDVAVDVDPRCASQSAPSWCEAGDAGVCVDLQRDPRNCGRCGRGCDSVRTECFAGDCFVPFPDAGRD